MYEIYKQPYGEGAKLVAVKSSEVEAEHELHRLTIDHPLTAFFICPSTAA